MRPVNTSLFVTSLFFLSFPAIAEDATGPGSNPSTLTADPMAPGPLTFVPPPTHGPAYGDSITDDFALTYHGYLSAPFHAGLGERTAATKTDDNSTPIHGLNLNVPDNTYNTWTLTNSQPGTWANVTFGIGTSHVYGTIYFGAWNHSKGQQIESMASYAQGSLSFYPALNVKVDDVLGTKMRLHLAVGGVGGRYGTAGKYDSGPYGTPIVGAVFGVGEQVGLERDFGDFTLRFEEGFGGNDHSPSDPRGSTLFAHTHLMGSYKDAIKGGIHYMTSFTQDERNPSKAADPDGSISVVGADVRFNGGIYGELFLGGSYVKVKHAAHVDGTIQVAHIAGGQGMMDNFLGNRPSEERRRDGLTSRTSSCSTTTASEPWRAIPRISGVTAPI